jgi:DNA polymerase IV (DinB-like DNA polymerase)
MATYVKNDPCAVPQVGCDLVMNEPPRIILHIDMDSFYASVEMKERPELQGKPVVIGADPKDGKGRGVVFTCSYEARAYSIRSAMPISQAFVLCPNAIFLPPDFPLYSRVSETVMTLLRSYGFRSEQVSIDEAFLDVSPLGSFRAAQELAKNIKSSIQDQLGLTCSIGIAHGKIFAKIASDFKKPDGLTIVEPHGIREFLRPMAVKKIPGIGRKSEAELLLLGIRTIGDLASSDIQVLIARFGRSAVAMHEIAQGIDGSEVLERDGIKSVSRETTFEWDTDNPHLISTTLETLVMDVHRNLIDEGLRYKTLTVKIRYQGFVTKTKARTFSHYTNDTPAMRTCARALLHDLFDGRKIRLLGIRLSSFDRWDSRQRTLFSD